MANHFSKFDYQVFWGEYKQLSLWGLAPREARTGKLARARRRNTPQISASETAFFVKIAHFYETRISALSTTSTAPISEPKVKHVNHEEKWFVVCVSFLGVDTPMLPFDMLGEDAVQKLPFGAREITQREYDKYSRATSSSIAESSTQSVRPEEASDSKAADSPALPIEEQRKKEF